MLDLSKLYHLPWTKYNSPNGFIEVTTFCQLECPGCYRECNQGRQSVHKPIEEIKDDIDRFVIERNVNFISFSGGEPLMYPHLNEAIRYTKSKSLAARIITNGILLDREKIIELRDAGLTEFNVHIDKHMGFSNANKFREQICDMFRDIDGIRFGFIVTVANETREDLVDLVDICKKNLDVVDFLVVTTYGNIFEDTISSLTSPDTQEIIDFLAKKFYGQPCAYIGKTISKNQPGWLFTYSVFKNEKFVRTFTADDYKKFWKKMYLEDKVHDPKNNILEDGSKFLTIQLIDSPSRVGNKWDHTAEFPDGMYYKGDIITACLLESIKKGEVE